MKTKTEILDFYFETLERYNELKKEVLEVEERLKKFKNIEEPKE